MASDAQSSGGGKLASASVRPCLARAWQAHESELRAFLRHRAAQDADGDDLLHEVFLKAVRQGDAFCAIAQPRAWLFQVARNALADRFRSAQSAATLDEALAADAASPPAAVDLLAHCLPRVLGELSDDDRLAITLCDIEGQSQQALADRLGLTLPGAKSRLQRARRRLREQLVSACQVRFDASGEVCCFTPRPPL